MSTRMQNATFTMTKNQLQWLKDQHHKTGLTQVEIVRRALDEYAEREESKERRSLFTPQQRQDIRDAAREKGISEAEVVRRAVNRELNTILRRF